MREVFFGNHILRFGQSYAAKLGVERKSRSSVFISLRINKIQHLLCLRTACRLCIIVAAGRGRWSRCRGRGRLNRGGRFGCCGRRANGGLCRGSGAASRLLGGCIANVAYACASFCHWAYYVYAGGCGPYAVTCAARLAACRKRGVARRHCQH